MSEQLLIALLGAGGGAALLRLLDWLLSRGKEKQVAYKEQQALDNSRLAEDTKLSAALRDELREENKELRARLDYMDGRLTEVQKTNTAVLLENYKLTAENMRLQTQVETLLAELDKGRKAA